MILVMFAGGAKAEAQVVAGQLTEQSGAPVAEAIVSLVDSAGAEVARSSTSTSGRFRLAPGRAGTYRVRVFRIGHGPWTSDPVALRGGPVETLDAVVPAQPISLPELVTVAEGRCEAGAAGGTAAAVLLEEARKALSLAREANRRGVSFAVTTFDIELDPDLRVVAERGSQQTSNRDLPVVSTTIDTLRRFGFVRQVPAYDPNGPMYYGPDDSVLLSDWFLTTHCFSVAESGDSTITVRFAPAERRGLPDIQGTMQFGADSLVLRSLQFTYVRLPRWVPDGTAGGALEFRRVPGSGIVVTQWWLRAPIAAVPAGRGDTKLHGYREAGGVVTGIVRAGEVVPFASSDSLLRRSELEAEAVHSEGDSRAGAAEPVLLQQEIPGTAGRRILARNDGTVAATIDVLEVRQCFNVAVGCGRHELQREVPPGGTVQLLILRPRDAARDYSFALHYEWSSAPP